MGSRTSAILLTALLGATTVLAQATLLQQATTAFNSAQQAEKALNEKPQAERSRNEVLKVIASYQRVYLITPKTSYADDALVAVARLYESVADTPDAIKTLNFLVREYPQTPFKSAAQHDIARLSGAAEAVPSMPENSVDLLADSRTNSKAGAKVTVDDIQYWQAQKLIRVVVYLSGEVTFKQGEAKSPDRVFVDIPHAYVNPSLMSKEWHVESGLLQKIRVGQNDAGTVRVVLDVGGILRATSFTLRDPDRLVIDVEGENAVSSPVAPIVTNASPGPEIKVSNLSNQGPRMATAAQPTNQGNRSLTRAFGLKVAKVVIDAGHGGHDTGSIGPTGFTEKELVLDVAKRLKTLIEAEIGAEVILTRDDDTFVPLEARTAIANQQEADLFISIHANSSSAKAARGVETYLLNFTTSKDALETASRENAASDRSIHELQDLVNKILLREKVDESRELAQHVQAAMSKSKDSGPDRGVKQAPFIVLIDARMPAILAEINFISNPDEEKALKTPQYRQQIAESLLTGVRSYADTLSSVKTAKSIDKN